MERLTLLQAVTSVRVGEGRALGAVDLPVQRERHTGWPVIAGSTIKGALRERARFLGLADEHRARWLDVFGREHPDAGNPHPGGMRESGRVRFAPAVLLALPLRSVTGTFILATSPLALSRFARAAGMDDAAIPQPASPEAMRVIPASADRLGTAVSSAHGNARLAGVEEAVLLVQEDVATANWAAFLGEFFDPRWEPSAIFEHLAVVHDEVFDFACRYWTAVRTRNAIDPKKGIVEEGKLFTVESLPPETLLWTLVSGLEPEDDEVLPARGETWWVGGHRQVGLGRVTSWWRTE